MATKAELLGTLTKAQLEELAGQYDVTLQTSTKSEQVNELEASSAVRVADIESFIAGADSDREGSMAEPDKTVDDTEEEEDYEGEESGGASASGDAPVVADAGDPEPEEIEPPDSPPEPTTPIHMREPEMADAPPSQAPAVALAEVDDAVDIDAQGRIFRSTPDVLISDSAAEAGGEAPDEEQLESYVGWVKLGELSGDLEKYSGREAAIIKAPQTVNDDPGFTTTGGKLVAGEGGVITVRTRDTDSAVLQITAEDIGEMAPSRVGLPSAG